MQKLDHNVCIVDDDPAVANALKMLLETQGCNVSVYPSGIPFLESNLSNFEGCVLLDVRMPKKDGLTVLSEALAINPNLYIVMMSGHGDIPMAVKAIGKGAIDFIEKPFQASVILTAMEKACEKLNVKTSETTFQNTARKNYALLTPRECEVMERLVDGKANKIVAFELGISIRTVETHRARILSKMQASSLAGLVKMHLAAKG